MILLTLSSFPGFAQERDNASDKAWTFLTNMIEKNETPGLQYLFVDAHNVIFRHNGGYADLTKNKPVTDDTTYNAYSVTKIFTAAAILKLASQQRINLDSSIDVYLPDYKFSKKPSVRQVLQHIGGVPNPNPITWIHFAEEHATFDQTSFVKKVVSENANRIDAVGEKFSYSNVGYMILGEIIARVSGMSFEDYVMHDIVAPLKLPHDALISFSIPSRESHARGYIRKWSFANLLMGWFIDRDTYFNGTINGWSELRDIQVNGSAYGGLIANANGFAQFLQAMLRVDTPFTETTLNQFWQTTHRNDGDKTPVTLAWFDGELNGERYFSHAGGGGGYYCEIRIYPRIGKASVIMMNHTFLSFKRYLDHVDTFFIENSTSPPKP